MLPTVRQLAGIAIKDYRREKGGRGTRQRGGERGRGRGSDGRRNNAGGRYTDGVRGEGGSRGGRMREGTKERRRSCEGEAVRCRVFASSDVVEVGTHGLRPPVEDIEVPCVHELLLRGL